jgi:hypothetical protein
MFKVDVDEAAPIVRRALQKMLTLIPTHGRSGADARTAIGDVMASIRPLLGGDVIGQPLNRCFILIRDAGITMKLLKELRLAIELETPTKPGAIVVKNSLIHFCLATEAEVITTMQFEVRADAEQMKLDMNAAFEPAEEIAADDMDAMSYQALVALHATVIFYLIETARPLPRMLKFRFAVPMPTLILAHRLYYDASRADELKNENRVVHPAFALPTGQALSK